MSYCRCIRMVHSRQMIFYMLSGDVSPRPEATPRDFLSHPWCILMWLISYYRRVKKERHVSNLDVEISWQNSAATICAVDMFLVVLFGKAIVSMIHFVLLSCHNIMSLYVNIILSTFLSILSTFNIYMPPCLMCGFSYSSLGPDELSSLQPPDRDPFLSGAA